MVLNSLSLCLSIKLLVLPPNLNEIFAGLTNLGVHFFLSSLYSASPFWSAELLWKNQLLTLGILLYIISCFSLAGFNIFSLCLIFFPPFFNMCLCAFLFEFIAYGTLWTLVAISFIPC